MARGTFSHSKLKNVMKGLTKVGPFTIHHPSGVSTTVFDASVKYKDDQVPLVVVAGENFGRGSARDWATKGPYLLGKITKLTLPKVAPIGFSAGGRYKNLGGQYYMTLIVSSTL